MQRVSIRAMNYGNRNHCILTPPTGNMYFRNEYEFCGCRCHHNRFQNLRRNSSNGTIASKKVPDILEGVDVITAQSRRNVIARGMKRFEDKGECPPQPDIYRLSPRVVTILGHNPTTFTLNGTNCYLIGTGSSRILVDPGESGYGTNIFLSSLRKCIKDEKVTNICLIIVTHMHSDHYGNIHHIQEEYVSSRIVIHQNFLYMY